MQFSSFCRCRRLYIDVCIYTQELQADLRLHLCVTATAYHDGKSFTATSSMTACDAAPRFPSFDDSYKLSEGLAALPDPALTTSEELAPSSVRSDSRVRMLHETVAGSGEYHVGARPARVDEQDPQSMRLDACQKAEQVRPFPAAGAHGSGRNAPVESEKTHRSDGRNNSHA